MVKLNLYVLFCSLSKLSVSTTDLPSSLRGLLQRSPLQWFHTIPFVRAFTCTRLHFIRTVKCKCKLLLTHFPVCYQYRSSNTRLSYNKAKFSIFNVYTFVTGRTVFWHWETSFPLFLYLPSLHAFTARICSFHQFSCCPQVFLPFPTCRCIKRRRAVEERSGEPKQGRR